MPVSQLIPTLTLLLFYHYSYHSDFESHTLGKLSALREIALTIEGNYKYYYMGYYIHSCAKMRYKAAYCPTEVLDLHNLQFTPLTKEILGKMDTKRYVSPSLEEKLRIAGGAATNEVDKNGILEDYVKAQQRQGEDSEEDDNNENEEKRKREKAQWVFDANMPGAMALDEIEERSDELGDWPFRLGDRGFFRHKVHYCFSSFSFSFFFFFSWFLLLLLLFLFLRFYAVNEKIEDAE